MKTVSIIIPIYNSAETLPSCLGSVLASSYKALEVILLDDGSVDNSLDICREYAEKDGRIRVFHHENHGVSYTRNRGLDEMTGDYVMFVDADDTISEGWVEAYASAIQSANAKLVIGGLTERQKNGDIAERRLPEVGKLTKEKMLQMLCESSYAEFGYVPNKIYDAGIINENHIRFNENMVVQEDLDFFLSYINFVDGAEIITECGYFYEVCLGKRIAPMLNLIHNKQKIFEMASEYRFDFSTLANDMCGHVYHYLRDLKFDKNYIPSAKLLETYNIASVEKYVTRNGEKRFVFQKAVNGKYRFLKAYFWVRNLRRRLKNK